MHLLTEDVQELDRKGVQTSVVANLLLYPGQLLSLGYLLLINDVERHRSSGMLEPSWRRV
jgi:hypothetical protein